MEIRFLVFPADSLITELNAFLLCGSVITNNSQIFALTKYIFHTSLCGQLKLLMILWSGYEIFMSDVFSKSVILRTKPKFDSVPPDFIKQFQIQFCIHMKLENPTQFCDRSYLKVNSP
jgi:hypothetical protein